MKHVKITNESSRPTDELMPLLRVAYASAKDEFHRPCDRLHPIKLKIGRTRTRMWCCRSNYDSGTICFSNPGRFDRDQTAVGNQHCDGINEVIIGVAAWVFSVAKGGGLVAQACTRDAVLHYRAHKAEIDGQIAAVIQWKKDREGEAFAREVFDGLEQSKLEYKLAQIEKKEKVWLRKHKLATTKLKSLRRSRSALIAADKRKQRTQEAQGATGALPLQPTQP